MANKAKRNVKKKVVRKDVVKVKSVSKATREDFEVFAKGVERLEELRSELNDLNAGGHEAEVLSIRSKLKNVSYIPEIEREMRVLKAKVKGNYKEKKETISHANIHGKIDQMKRGVPNDHASIHRKINQLKESVPDKRRINKKLKELEDEIDKKGRLSGKDVKLVKDIPKIKDSLSSFREFLEREKEEAERKKVMLGRIDPEVSFLVNDKFNLTLNEIKSRLSERLQSKELAVQRQLQDDLIDRKKSFEVQYSKLEKNFEKKYNDRVKFALEEEVRSRFDSMLNKRVEATRKRLELESIKRLRLKEKRLREIERKKLLEAKLLINSLNKLKKKVQIDSADKLRKIKFSSANKLKLEIGKLVGIEKLRIVKVEGLERLKEERRKKLEEVKVCRDSLSKLRKRLQKDNIKKFGLNGRKLKAMEKRLRNAERNKLLGGIEKNRISLEKEYKRNLDIEKGKMKHLAREEILTSRVVADRKMHEHLTREVGEVHKNYANKLKKSNEGINKIKRQLASEKDVFSKVRNRLSLKARKIKEDDGAYRKGLIDRLEKEKKNAVEKTVRQQSDTIRKQLKKEFDERLKREISVKKAEFEKKKSDLALDIQRKTKLLFD